MRRKVWRAIGWLLRPIQISLLSGFVSLGLSAAYDWAEGWRLVWSFFIPMGTMLAMQVLFAQIDKWTAPPKATSAASRKGHRRDPS